MQDYAQILTNILVEPHFSIRDPLWKDIQLPRAFKPILNDRTVQKLNRIKQLGPSFLLYPGAVHTRFNHSLGVYHIGRQILTNLLKQAMNGLIEPPISEDGARAFFCACLLHDIGHFPFAHSLKELPLLEHEQIARNLICSDDTLNNAIRQAGIEPEFVGTIIDESLETESPEILFYRTILSGSLDPDKLDYLNRDAFFCGVPYGIQDVSYITDKLTLHEGRIAVSEQALGSVEHLLFSKYLMYRNVYWHKTVRSATSMIKKAVLSCLEDGSLTEQMLYDLDDEEFFLLPTHTESEAMNLFSQVRENRLYNLTFEKPFAAHGTLEIECRTLEDRTRFEQALARKLGISPFSIIVDIPEPISFETHIPIISENGTAQRFENLDIVFSYDISRVFTKSLRNFRIFTASDVDKQNVRNALEL